jgi:hypothetical protein
MVFTAFIIAALAGAAMIGASLSGVASGAVQHLLRTMGLEQNSALAVEQRRQAQALEEIERSVGRVRADVALLNVRVAEAENWRQEAVNAAPAAAMPVNLAPRSGPEFDLGLLRDSFDGEAERADFRPVTARAPRRSGQQIMRRPRPLPARTAVPWT